MEERICSVCRKAKTLDQFRKDNRRKSGTASYCKACSSQKELDRRKKVKGRPSAPVTPDRPPAPVPSAPGSAPVAPGVPAGSLPDPVTVIPIRSNPRYPAPKWRRHSFIVRDEVLRLLQVKAYTEGRDLTALLDSILSAVLQPLQRQ